MQQNANALLKNIKILNFVNKERSQEPRWVSGTKVKIYSQ